MKILGKRNYLLSLESVAMTDIVLNMFIFFFISFSLLYTFNPFQVKKLDIKLPKAEFASTVQEPDQITISLSAEGTLYLEKELVNLKELKEKIQALDKSRPSISVMVQVDKRVHFQNVVQVLDLLSGLGIERVNIATMEKEEK